MHIDRCARFATLYVAVSCLLGCAVNAGEPSDHVAQGLSATLTEDFEAYPTGPLGAPWSTSFAGTSTWRVASVAGHGKVGVLHGGTTTADFLIASLPAASSQPVIQLSFAINPAPGASFVFSLQGAGGSIGARRIRLQRAAGSSMLAASTAGFGTLDCGALPSSVWSTITLDVRTDTHTFDVSINGAPTACSGGSTEIGTPFTGVSAMDASNEGWGGDVQLDDITLTADAAPTCVPPVTPDRTVLDVRFDSDPSGDLVAPWAVTQSARKLSTARVTAASGHGQALALHGSTSSGEFVIADRAFAVPADQTDVRFDFAIRPSTSAAFVIALEGVGGSLGARRIRLQRAPGSSVLVADTAGSSNKSCGTLSSNAWSQVSLRVHTASTPHTFDVLINGATTACNASPTEMGAPFDAINIMDASNTGWGRDVLLDDLLVIASGAPSGSCP